MAALGGPPLPQPGDLRCPSPRPSIQTRRAQPLTTSLQADHHTTWLRRMLPCRKHSLPGLREAPTQARSGASGMGASD